MSSYKDYLKSEHWLKFRKRYYIIKKPKGCMWCGKKTRRLQLHHKTYARVGKEKWDDVVAICNLCHKAVHHIQKTEKISVEKASEIIQAETKHFRKEFKKRKEFDAGLTRTSTGKARKRAYQRASEIRDEFDAAFDRAIYK